MSNTEQQSEIVDPLQLLKDYGGHVHEESYSICIDTEDAKNAMEEYAKIRLDNLLIYTADLEKQLSEAKALLKEKQEWINSHV